MVLSCIEPKAQQPPNMPAPDVIHHLIQRFEDNLASYRSAGYNETQLRREFLDPFFEALGWDVFNQQGYAEAYKDVIHEDAIKIGGGDTRPRLCLPHRRVAQVLRRSQETLRQYQRRYQPGFSTAPLCLVGEAAAFDPDRFRRVRRL